ncbi:serine hydrolase [Desulforhopalus vacuolatus]|uniref:serine hydrolase n=1 Tax=Desulforhopalus vacuolatus TaxID=40414 RepID=UPI001966B5A0|nr:serine hydrolase [Desulforhopalus vacuolatus]MBM9520004.1 serine hydrolase [Desulforhopalus vacuolatus]
MKPLFSLLGRTAFSVLVIAVFAVPVLSLAAQPQVKYDLVYLNSRELDRILDYKQELESIFDNTISDKIKVMGKGSEYALIYDCNSSRKNVYKTLKKHSKTLHAAGFDEPYALRDNFFHPLYNISYRTGRNLDELKNLYSTVSNTIGSQLHDELYIEQNDSGSYTLVYHYCGERKLAQRTADEQSLALGQTGIKPKIVPEDGKNVVYGESSRINDDPVEQKIVDDINRDRRGRLVIKALKIVKYHLKVKEGAVAALLADKHKVKYSRGHQPVVAGTSLEVEGGGKADTSVKIATVRPPPPAPGYRRAGGPPPPPPRHLASYNMGRTNTALEKSIEHHIDTLRSTGQIRGDEATGWMVYDLQQNESVVDINAEKQFQAASMIKPFVALAFFHQVKEGKLKYGAKARRKLSLMIQHSNNAATNWVMKQVGGPLACDRLLRKYYHKTLRNIHIREYIPAGGRTYRNTAAPADYVRFLRALWDDNLPNSREIRRLMALPGRDRIYNGTPIPKGTLVYNKTGSTAHLIGDMGILVPKTQSGRRYPYIVVGLIERSSRASNYSGWMNSRGNIIREVSTLVYKDLKRDHHLR